MQGTKILLAIITTLLLAACSNHATEPLRLGTNIWPGFEPLYLARTKHFLDTKKIDLVELSSTSQVLKAYRNNLIDAATLTLDEVIQLLATGEKLKIILVMDISHGGDAIIGQPDIHSLKALAGKRIAVENNALGAYVLARALETHHMPNNSFDIMQIDVSEQEKAFVTRTIDAAVTYEPVRTKLLAAGGHTLFDSKEIPNEIVDVLVVREQYLNQHPDIVRHLMNGWFKALAYITSNPGKAATILGQRMKLNVDDTLNTYKGLQLPDRKLNAELLNTRPPKLLTTVRKLITIMLQTGLLVKEFSPAKPFTTDVQSRILNQGKTK